MQSNSVLHRRLHGLPCVKHDTKNNVHFINNTVLIDVKGTHKNRGGLYGSKILISLLPPLFDASLCL